MSQGLSSLLPQLTAFPAFERADLRRSKSITGPKHIKSTDVNARPTAPGYQPEGTCSPRGGLVSIPQTGDHPLVRLSRVSTPLNAQRSPQFPLPPAFALIILRNNPIPESAMADLEEVRVEK